VINSFKGIPFYKNFWEIYVFVYCKLIYIFGVVFLPIYGLFYRIFSRSYHSKKKLFWSIKIGSF